MSTLLRSALSSSARRAATASTVPSASAAAASRAAVATATTRGYASSPAAGSGAQNFNMTKFTKFDWEDPLAFNKNLSDEELAISETARSFAQEHLKPKVIQMNRDESWDPTILPAMGELGLLGPTIQGYGCAGVSNVCYGLITREIERVDSSYRSMMSVQSSLAMGAIYQFGTDAQKERFLPRMAKGELVGCFGLTEPNHGSDPSGMETTAEDNGQGEFVLNGSKTWISSAPYADIFVIWAKCKWDKKVRGFVVDKNALKGTRSAHGLEAPKIAHKTALRASVTGSIFLDNVVVRQEDALLSRARPGLGAPFECLNSARFGIGWGAMGALEACIDEARSYALDRKQFQRPLAGFQLVQRKIVDASTEASLGLLAALQVGRAKDEGQWNPEMVSMIKRNNCGKALKHARILLEVLGGNAASDEYHIARHAGNLHVVNTYEGTYDIHGLILGKAITGEQAFF